MHESHMVAKCPMDGCDYEGPARSVEAHVSGTSDDLHRGELGRNWRSVIEASHESDEQAAEASAEATETPSEGSNQEGVGVPPGAAVLVATVLLGLMVVATSVEGSAGGSDEQVEQPDEDGEELAEVSWNA